MTLTDIESIGALDAADRTFQMDEEAFRGFYELTARPVWVYLARVTGDERLADDLLQETYYRFLRARAAFASDDHRRHYLFRIATNLARDHFRQPHATAEIAGHVGSDAGAADREAVRIDVTRAMTRLTPRERSILWLAYAQGWTHEEIARTVGVTPASLKTLLYRARRRLATLLEGRGVAGGKS
jgi:RNA polymerase sigma-70 factor (ECF subfamily)